MPEPVLIDRVVGRRSDPVTGRIYHLSFSPPESEEVAARLTQREDDTEDKVGRTGGREGGREEVQRG